MKTVSKNKTVRLYFIKEKALNCLQQLGLVFDDNQPSKVGCISCIYCMHSSENEQEQRC